MKLFLIAGLGNPGNTYSRHRHNVGFMVLDELARRHQAAFTRSRGKALYADFHINNAKLLLAKPQTFMNSSGGTLKNLIDYYNVPLEQVLIVLDDLDLPTAALRMRPHGGSAGQKGMQSIIERLGSDAIPRLRVGIGRPSGQMDPATYVLQPFTSKQKELIDAVLPLAVHAIETFVHSGIEIAMSTFNSTSPGE